MPRPRLRVFLAALLAFAVFGGVRAWFSHGIGGDFLRYHRAGRMVVTGRADLLYDEAFLARQQVYAEERRSAPADADGWRETFPEAEYKYLPATAVMLAPLGALHPRLAWALWGSWNATLIVLTFAAAWDLAARGSPWTWALLPLVILVREAVQNQNLGQLNPSAIAPATLAVWALDRGRDRTAGALAAFGGVVKFVPLGLVLWFALKRRYKAAAAAVVVFLAIAWVLPAAVLGPARTNALHDAYREARAHVYTDDAPDDLPGHSIKSFVYRLLGPTRYRTGSRTTRVDLHVGVARASPGTLLAVSVGVVVLLLGVVVWAAWGPLRAGDDVRGPPEAGIFFCWLLLASPEARAPHFLYLAVPVMALSSLLRRAWSEGWAGRRTATALAVAGAFLVLVEGQSLVGRQVANWFAAYCCLGWATLAFFAALLLLLRDAGRRSPADPRHASPAAAPAV